MSCGEVRAAAFVVALIVKKKQMKKRKRNMWVRDWVLARNELGAHDTLIRELRDGDPKQLDNFLRMSKEMFDQLLAMVGPKIQKQDTNMRRAISASERLCVTLRYLATGDSYHSLMYLFRIPVCTISIIVPECCEAIYISLKDEFLKTPKEQDEWLEKAERFEEAWQFPHCVGALDGKHVAIQAPSRGGSYWYNYKGFHSIVLMALVDAEYKFTYVDVGCNGRVSDGGVFTNCSLSTALAENSLNFPPSGPLPAREKNVPYVIVADDAFALKQYLMKPFPSSGQGALNRIYNYRLSRARRVVENAFGIIANRFRVLRKPIELCPQKASNVVLSICALHNFLMKRNRRSYAAPSLIDSDDRLGDWRVLGMPERNLFPLENNNCHNYSLPAKAVRDELRDYFVSPEGEIPWQYKNI